MWKYLSLTAFFPFTLQAQEPITDTTHVYEVYIQESRFQIPFSQYNRNLQIISAEDLKKMPVQSVAEALSWIGGVDVRQRGPFGTQADVSIQGGSFEQTLILVDGHKISDVQTAHHSLNIPIPLSAIDRIEILQGPAARKFGINTLTGAINIVTKTPNAPLLAIQTQVGSAFRSKEAGDGAGMYTGTQVDATLSLYKKQLKHLLAINVLNTNGQRYNSGNEQYRAWYNGEYAVTDGGKLTWYAGHIFNEFGANGFYAAPIDKESEELVKTNLIGLSYHQHWNNIHLRPSISFRKNEDDYRFYRHDWSKSRSQHETQVFTADVQATINLNGVDIGMGWESRREEIKSSNIGNHERINHGLFAEIKLEPIEKLHAQLGAYVNYNSDYKWNIYPGVDLGYAFNKNFRWRLAINTGQRLPSFTDLYLQQAPANVGNALLRSEHALQYESALSYHSVIGQLDFHYFHRSISNFIDWIREDSTVPYQPQNMGHMLMQGLGFMWSGQLPSNSLDKVGYKLGYNYLLPKQKQETNVYMSKYVLENLEHQVGFQLYGMYGHWQGSWNMRVLKRAQADLYELTDAQIFYHQRQWRCGLIMNNVFGTNYTEIGAIPLPQRWVSLKFNILIN